MENNKLKLQGEWKDVKNRIKKTYPELTDEDLTYEEGNSNGEIDVLLERIQQKTGKTKKEAKEWIERL